MTTTSLPDYRSMKFDGYQSVIKNFGPDLCDFYAVTRAYALWKLEMVEQKIVTSHVFCRSLSPNGETYTDGDGKKREVEIPFLVNSGLGLIAEFCDAWRWEDNHLSNLAKIDAKNEKGAIQRVFPNEFLFWLSQQKLSLDIDAVPEGELVFPHQAVIRVKGLDEQQALLEAPMLHFQSASTAQTTLDVQVRLATRRLAQSEGASIVEASTRDIYEEATLIEMALRRTPSLGGIIPARSAAIAGWNSTSNVYASRCYGIKMNPGTFAHSWVMLHDTEEEAFENWAKVFSGSSIFLCDTYDTIEGVKTAIKVCKKYNITPKGIKLDSGNMAYLAEEAGKLFVDAGWPDVVMIPTNRINLRSAKSLFQPANPNIRGFGIGSEAAINRYQPLLDFVMKLGARFADRTTGKDELVKELMKLSETSDKSSFPGEIDTVRFVYADGRWGGDMIIPANMDLGNGRLRDDVRSISILEGGKNKIFYSGTRFVHLSQPLMRSGKMQQPNFINRDAPAIVAAAAETCKQTVSRLDPSHLLTPPEIPHRYGVGVIDKLYNKREATAEAGKMERDRTRQMQLFGCTVA
jgi:nicotinate phosphoribosyltransferase